MRAKPRIRRSFWAVFAPGAKRPLSAPLTRRGLAISMFLYDQGVGIITQTLEEFGQRKVWAGFRRRGWRCKKVAARTRWRGATPPHWHVSPSRAET